MTTIAPQLQSRSGPPLFRSGAMTTTALAGWFGSNRTLASTVGDHLGRCEWVGVPFCGGCCELPHIKTRTGVANDLHRHLINLARVVREPTLKDELAARLDTTLFHPEELAVSQRRCMARDDSFAVASSLSGVINDVPDIAWAYDYFLCCWMGRGGKAGTDGEFKQGMSVRWNANGGDSCTRFRSARESLDAWCGSLRNWNFVVQDAFEFLANAKDSIGHGLYVDAPWPEAGDVYRHKFDEAKQRALAERLRSFRKTRVVIRYGIHPLIEEIYPRSCWNWIEQTSRSQANGSVNEVLILNSASQETHP
jgi:DNA adenine methylase